MTQTPGTDQILAELIQVREYVSSKNFHSSKGNLLLWLFTKTVIKLTVVIKELKFFPVFFLKVTPYVGEIVRDHQCRYRRNRPITAQIFSIDQILEKKWEYNGTVHKLFIDSEKAYDLVRTEVLNNILTEFGVTVKLMFKQNLQ
jgi:hypothetical protein